MKRNPRRRFGIWILGLVGLLGLALLVAGWRVQVRRNLVWSHLPAPVDRPNWPEELRTRVTEADRLAAGYFGQVPGLAELSRLYHANACPEEALLCYEGLLQLEPEVPRWPHLAATLLAGYGRLDEALPLWQRAVELDPDYLPSRLRLGDVLLKSNRPVEAQVAYKGVLERWPTDPHARLGLARCSMVAGDWLRARAQLDAILKRDPEFAGALTLMVAVHESMGDLEAADAWRARVGMKEPIDIRDPWLEALMDDCYDAYRVSVAAAVAVFADDLDRAQFLLKRAIQLAPDSGSYQRQMGKLLLQREDNRRALAHFEQAVALNPQDEEARAYLIRILMTTGDERAVDREIAAGLAATPKSATMHFFHGRQLSQQGRVEEAIAEFKTARQLKPDNVRPYLELAVTYFRLNRTEQGLAELEGALEAEPGNLLALSLMARHAIHSGDQTAANAWMTRIRRQPRFPASDLTNLLSEYETSFGHPFRD